MPHHGYKFQILVTTRFGSETLKLAPPRLVAFDAEIFESAGLPQVSGLDDGETAAIALAEFLGADLLLMDERDGYRVAQRKGLPVTGTLACSISPPNAAWLISRTRSQNWHKQHSGGRKRCSKHFCRNTSGSYDGNLSRTHRQLPGPGVCPRRSPRPGTK